MKCRLRRVAGFAALGAALCATALAQAAADQTSADALTRARTMAVSGELPQAESILRDLIRSQPSSADAHFLLGYVLFREGKATASLAEFTVGARTRRPAADDFRIIASDYVLLHDYSDAVKWFLEVAKETPSDPVAWYLLGRAQYNNQDFRSAITSFQHALTLRAQYVEAENNLGLAWQGLGDPADAEIAFRVAIGWQGSHPSDAQPYLNLGDLLVQEDKGEQALPSLQTAVRLAPANPRIHEELGRAYESGGNLARAQQELEKAAALAPEVSGLHYELGRIYQREGQPSRAREQFDICAKLNATHSSTETPNPFSPE